MRLTEYLLMLVKAYNPNQYERMLERPGREFGAFLFLTVLLALLVFTILIVPVTLHYIGTVPARTAQVEQLELNADVTATQPVTLLERPNIILDLSANTTNKGEITLSNEGLIYPKYLFFGTGMIKWSDIHNLKEQTPTRDRVLSSVIIFLLPSIIFWFFLWSGIKLALVFLALFILGLLAPRLFRHRISAKDTLKLVILAMPSAIILDFGLYPLGAPSLTWWGIGLTTGFFLIGITMMSELSLGEEEPRHPHKEHKFEHKK